MIADVHTPDEPTPFIPVIPDTPEPHPDPPPGSPAPLPGPDPDPLLPPPFVPPAV